MTGDIDCSETSEWNSGAGFLPLGSWDNPFLGELDGDYHTINNLFIDTTLGDNNPGGLFDRIGQSDNQVGLVKDLGLEDADITGGWSTGGLVGVLYGQANNTYTTGTVNGSGEVGGLVGSHGGIWDTVINSWSSATVTGTADVVGGLVGYNAQDSNIINSYATGAVIGGDDNTGGLVGINNGNVTNAYASGSVTGPDTNTGGLAGRNTGTITLSYATGHVWGENSNTGGLVGSNGGEINKSYSHNTLGDEPAYGVIGDCSVGGLVGLNTSTPGNINNSYSRSTVANDTLACAGGGFVGTNEGYIYQTYSTGNANGSVMDTGGYAGSAASENSAYISVSFWDTQTSGLTDACGSFSTFTCDAGYNAMGRSSSDMKIQENYTNDLGEGAWDFESVWTFVEGQNDNYPVLRNIGYTPVEWNEVGQEDLNGDEIPDSEQPNIGGYESSITGKTVAIDVGENRELTVDDMTTEANLAVQDPAYEYVSGLWDFEADCGDPGQTTTVRLYYYDVSPGSLVLRKHNPSTNAFFTIDDAGITTQTINGSSVTVVTYQITDGGERDTDGLADGMISDPAGLAQSVVGAPNTGL